MAVIDTTAKTKIQPASLGPSHIGARVRPLSYGDKVKFLVHGDPGSGKTVMAATSGGLIVRPPTDNVDSAHAQGLEAKQLVTNTWDEMWELYEWLRHDRPNFPWVWLDSISLWQDEGLDDVYDLMLARKKAGEDRDHRAQFGPDKGEYGTNMWRLSKWVRHMCALPDFHFGITAHTFRYTDPKTGEILYMPWVQGKEMPDKIVGYMNVVGYLTVRENKKGEQVRVMLTDKLESYYAKDQFNAFGGKIIRPTIPKMMAAIEAAAKEKKQ